NYVPRVVRDGNHVHSVAPGLRSLALQRDQRQNPKGGPGGIFAATQTAPPASAEHGNKTAHHSPALPVPSPSQAGGTFRSSRSRYALDQTFGIDFHKRGWRLI